MALGEGDVLLLAAAIAVYSICDAKRDWRLGTWFSGGLGSVRFMVGLDDLKGLFQPK